MTDKMIFESNVSYDTEIIARVNTPLDAMDAICASPLVGGGTGHQVVGFPIDILDGSYKYLINIIIDDELDEIPGATGEWFRSFLASSIWERESLPDRIEFVLRYEDRVDQLLQTLSVSA